MLAHLSAHRRRHSSAQSPYATQPNPQLDLTPRPFSPQCTPITAACPANSQRDAAGCCPRAFGVSLFYRDVRGCYPIATNVGVLYADASGCYPNEAGVYNPAGMACPAGRQCVPACD